MKPTQIITVLVLAIAPFISISVTADSPETRASKEYKLTKAVAKASRQWRDAFNAGDAEAAAAMYEEDAIMVAKPFGTFKGRDAIKAFWIKLIEGGFDDVVYFHTKARIVDKTLTAVSVSADWKMNNAQGIITNELWVLQADGTALLREDHFEVEQ